MKINLPEPPRLGKRPARRTRHRERGSAVFIVFVLLSIMLIYVNANLKLLSQLKAELKLIERRQLEKFESPPSGSLSTTNATRQPSAAKLLVPTNAIGAEPEKRTQ